MHRLACIRWRFTVATPREEFRLSVVRAKSRVARGNALLGDLLVVARYRAQTPDEALVALQPRLAYYRFIRTGVLLDAGTPF